MLNLIQKCLEEEKIPFRVNFYPLFILLTLFLPRELMEVVLRSKEQIILNNSMKMKIFVFS